MSKKQIAEWGAERVDKVKSLIVTELGAMGSEVTPGARLEDLAADEIDLVSLFIELEDFFYIEVQDDASPETVQDCVDLVIEGLVRDLGPQL